MRRAARRAVCSVQLNDPRCRDGAESLSADPHVFYKVSWPEVRYSYMEIVRLHTLALVPMLCRSRR